MNPLKNLWNRILGRAEQPQPQTAAQPRRSWRDFLPWNRRRKDKPQEPDEGPIDIGIELPKEEPPEGPIEPQEEPLQEPPKEKPEKPGRKDLNYIQYDYPVGPLPGSSWQGPEVSPASDETLLNRYRGMINTMVERGLINEFRNDKEAAEFLRVLSSRAWEEAHNYWGTSKGIFKDVQSAIEHGATAGVLQNDYNMMLEKKSKDYMGVFSSWGANERTDWPDDEESEAGETISTDETSILPEHVEEPAAPKAKKQTRKQKKRNRRK